MMETPMVRTTTQADEALAIDTIVLAFTADPMARWCWPRAHQYLTSMPSFTRAFGGAAFSCRSAHCTEDNAGVALWLPPNVHSDEEALGEVLGGTVSTSTRGDLFAVFEQMVQCHPAEPHWYLPVIGVDPAYQGRGYGDALMKHALEQCDRDHAPAYLESSNPRNVSLYQRHGFEAFGTIQVGASPPVVPMLRAAR
jgi:ribosomal protein S18 acetylase RimI-like enzyme